MPTFTKQPTLTGGGALLASRISNVCARKRSSAMAHLSLLPHAWAYHEQRLDAGLNLAEWSAATFIAAATRRSQDPLS